MNKFISLVLAACFMVGCDDAEVIGKVEEVLTYGGISGAVTCYANLPQMNHGGQGCLPAVVTTLRFYKGVDGSCVVQANPIENAPSSPGHYTSGSFSSRTAILPKGETGADTCKVSLNHSLGTDYFEIVDGELVTTRVHYNSGNCSGATNNVVLNHGTVDDTPCSNGINLSAFGLE